MTLHWPQITLLILITLEMGINLAKHGEPREPHSVWMKCIDCAVLIWLLHAGGFFGATS